MRSVIFVCLGNICRSPLAEALANKIASDEKLSLRVDSAGTGNWHVGEAPCDNSIQVAKNHGIDIAAYRARQVQKSDFEIFDMVVALDAKNYADLAKMGAKNLYLLGDFGFEGEDVPDPYYFNGFEGFEKVYDMIEQCVSRLIREHIDG